MRKILPTVIFFLLLFVFSLTVHTTTKADSTSKTIETAKIITPTVLPFQQVSPVYYPPTRISIPKINLTAHVISVGLDSLHRMDVPNNFVEVGWYDLGSKPGQQGSVVLDGHSDDFHGKPAVFYYLDTLVVGDKIVVTDQTGKEFTYIVSDTQTYPVEHLPLQQIFASTDKARLNLITCHGTWDNSIGTYNERTVVYAELHS